MADRLALSWQNISFYADIRVKSWWKRGRSQRVKLLHNVCGIAKSGTLTAIMGPSGAGKTTLLAAIGQRNTGNLHGEVYLNGRPIDKDLMLKITGFVPQQDLVVETLTVKEHLQFMSNLKMDRRVSGVQRSRIINTLLQDLGLEGCKETRLAQLSGGEKKRVALGVQMLTDPPFLLCDEPTTGLDSHTAQSVIGQLRSLAASKGKAIICTIHQPASGLYEMFDNVCLLAVGGRMAYFGPVAAALPYFSRLGMECPSSFNQAEFLVKQLSTEPDTLIDNFLISKEYASLVSEINTIKESAANHQLLFGMDEKFLKFYSVQPPPMISQLKWLVWRSALDLYRSSQNHVLNLALYILPRVIMEIFLFCCVIHLIVGIEGGAAGFFLFTIPVILSGIASSAYGYCVSAMFESITTASLLSVPIDFVSYSFSGLFLQLASVPFYLSWVKYISRFYYGLEAVSILQWSNVPIIPMLVCSS